MKNYLLIYVILFLALSSLALSDSCIYYFYGSDCPKCPEVNNYLTDLESKYSGLQIVKHEVYFDKEKAALLDQFFSAYKIPQASRGLPAIFLPDSYFIGPQSIMDTLEERIQGSTNPDCPSPKPVGVIGLAGDKSPKTVIETLTYGVVASTALGESLGIKMLALFVVLLILIILIREPDQNLLRGLLFLGGVFITYLLYGMGKLSWFAQYGYSFPKIMAIIGIVFAVGVLAEFLGLFRPLHKVKTGRELFIAFVKAWISPVGAILIGFLASIWTLINIEHKFNIMQILYLNPTTQKPVFSILCAYLFVLLLPMLLIFIIIYLIKWKIFDGINQQYKNHERNANTWKDHAWRIFNIVLSIILIGIAIYLLYRV